MRLIPWALALVSLTLLVSACGGEGASQKAAGDGPVATGELSPAKDPDGKSGPMPARSNEVDAAALRGEGGPSGRASAPCRLVTRAQAQAIVGGPVLKPVEAPQGPTCIYRYSGGRHLVTMVVQSRDTRALLRQLPRRTPMRVARHDGFCGHQGQPTLYVPLSPRQVLSVTAPCRIAAGFAQRALRHLG